jgi:hypothetical protein
VAWRVDEIDRYIVDRERDDRRLDGDAALPFKRERIGLRVAVIDTADRGDDPRGVQQSLGKTCLPRIDVRQNAQVDRFREATI